MIRFANGSQGTKAYEEMGLYVQNFEVRAIEYRNHLNFIGKDIFKKFLELKEDHDSGLISTGVYMDFLKPLKDLLERDDIDFPSGLQSEEIQAEISRYFK